MKRRVCADIGVTVIVIVTLFSAKTFAAPETAPTLADALREDGRVRQIESVARKLRHDLVCVCPRCARLRLDACGCPDAAAEREQITRMLGERDLSNEDGRLAAYGAVREFFIARSGRAVLADAPVPRDWTAPLVPLVVLVAFGGPCVWILKQQRSDSTRKRRNRHGA